MGHSLDVLVRVPRRRDPRAPVEGPGEHPRAGVGAARRVARVPTLRLLAETPGSYDLLHALASRPRVRGSAIHDARVAAQCLAHGVEALLTRDRDFSAFPELPTRDPFR